MCGATPHHLLISHLWLNKYPLAMPLNQGCGVGVRVVELESESEGILGGVGVGNKVLTLTPTSV
jgi:hypothetical protein